MTHDQLNSYIENYLINDKTQSAIMLTGAWGSGKSHYIKNSLNPYLQKKKKECVVVSLYGIKDLSEISKSIFLDLTINKINPIKAKKKSVLSTGTQIFAKALVKSIASYKGIEFKTSEKDIAKLFSSIDLSDKLIVFEDLERSHISIIELLGYINNFVEQDGIKVMLVANEFEILEYYYIDNPNKVKEKTHPLASPQPDKVKELTDVSRKYLKIKEKTVSDTIQYVGDYLNASKAIVNSFKNHMLIEVFNTLEESDVHYIFNPDRLTIELSGLNSTNLRSFIFSCQKTVAIYKMFPKEYDSELVKCLFLSILAFSFKFKSYNKISWDSDSQLSSTLGGYGYPLPKFAYDYIKFQSPFNINDIETYKYQYSEYLLYQPNNWKHDEDISALSSYYINTEYNLREVIKRIGVRLENPKDIPLYAYGELAVKLVIVSNIISEDITNCKTLLAKNLKGQGNNINHHHLFNTLIREESEKVKAEFNSLKEEMEKALNYSESIQSINIYSPEKLHSLCEEFNKPNSKLDFKDEFLSKVNLEKLIKVLKVSPAKTISVFRTTLRYVYDNASVEFSEKEISSLENFAKLVETVIKNNDCESPKMDKIQLLQMDYLLKNTIEFLTKIKGQENKI